VVEIDEIKKYLDYRYVSASEAAWRIFKFDMHERFPSVERLQYHLLNQQMVLFGNDDDVHEVVTRSAISKMMLTEWFKTNQESEVARSLTFDQFPQQWVWNRQLKRWTMRKRGIAIGRMYYAHPTSGERYYLPNVVELCQRCHILRAFCKQWMTESTTHSKMHAL